MVVVKSEFGINLFGLQGIVESKRKFGLQGIVESKRKFGLQGLMRVATLYELPFVLHLRKFFLYYQEQR
jgi:hypothetical protein